MAPNQPGRSNLKSDLKVTAQTTCVTMLVWAVLTISDQIAEERTHLAQLELSASPQLKIRQFVTKIGPVHRACASRCGVTSNSNYLGRRPR